MQTKTIIRYHLTLVRIAIIKSLQITNAGKDVKKKESPYTVGENLKWTIIWRFSKKKLK